MKKITLALIWLFYMNVSFGQTYTTGLIELSNTSGLEYSAQIDVNSTTVTLTMIGPSDRWLGLGFGVQSMTSSGDVVIYDGTTLTDRSFGYQGQPAGEPATGITPAEDPEGERDWSITSNVVNSGVRTLIATRATNTGQAKDYAFSASATSIELVWARYGFPGFDLEWHGMNNKGITMQGLTLSDDTVEFNDFKISPNPAKNSFILELGTFNNNAVVEIYDVLGKKVLNRKINAITTTFDISRWNSGLYILKISSEKSVVMKRFVKQ